MEIITHCALLRRFALRQQTCISSRLLFTSEQLLLIFVRTVQACGQVTTSSCSPWKYTEEHLVKHLVNIWYSLHFVRGPSDLDMVTPTKKSRGGGTTAAEAKSGLSPATKKDGRQKRGSKDGRRTTAKFRRRVEPSALGGLLSTR